MYVGNRIDLDGLSVSNAVPVLEKAPVNEKRLLSEDSIVGNADGVKNVPKDARRQI